MKNFSSSWNSSKKPRKQRKYRATAPLHVKQKLIHAHLSKELRSKHKMRSIGIRKGDKVKIMRGRFRKYEGKVDIVDLKKTRVFVSGAESTKKDGTKRQIPQHPSNLLVVELNMDDKLRQKSLEAKNG